MAATYGTKDFVLSEALVGTPVTLKTSVVEIETETGIFTNRIVNGLYEVIINNSIYWSNEKGEIRLPTAEGELRLVDTTMETTYGTYQPMTRGSASGEEGDDPKNVSVLEPRDEFAIAALKAMMSNLEHAETASDAAILFYSRAAYRWAQGMMIAAADARARQTESTSMEELEVNVSNGTNTEKLLYNLIVALKSC